MLQNFGFNVTWLLGKIYSFVHLFIQQLHVKFLLLPSKFSCKIIFPLQVFYDVVGKKNKSCNKDKESSILNDKS